MNKLVYGVGLNDLPKGSCKINGNHLPFYRTWISMLNRCYSKKFQDRCPTYKGCSVCAEWLLLSNFKKWHDSQYYVKGFQLDKDILVPNNKIYSPETCRFVPSTINSLLTDSCKARGKYVIGVSWHKRIKKFQLSVNGKNNLCEQKRKELKIKYYYYSELECHNVYRYIKSEVIKDTIKQLKIDHPKLDGAILDALQLRAEKLLNYNLKYEDFM